MRSWSALHRNKSAKSLLPRRPILTWITFNRFWYDALIHSCYYVVLSVLGIVAATPAPAAVAVLGLNMFELVWFWFWLFNHGSSPAAIKRCNLFSVGSISNSWKLKSHHQAVFDGCRRRLAWKKTREWKLLCIILICVTLIPIGAYLLLSKTHVIWFQSMIIYQRHTLT